MAGDAMRVVGVEEIRAIEPAVVFDAVKAALVAHAEGRTVVSPPMYLPFAGGDCHVKAGHVVGQPHFVVKTASSFGGRNTGSIRRVHAWGRRPEAETLLCEQLRADGLDARPGYQTGAACVVTATASPNPLPLAAFRDAVHVTGIGTDMPGQGELPPELFADALIVTDDHDQCLDHGVRAGVVGRQADRAAGSALAGSDRHRRSVADLTGIGATDASVAGAVWALLG
jgi:ornithine cyclodeaminase